MADLKDLYPNAKEGPPTYAETVSSGLDNEDDPHHFSHSSARTDNTMDLFLSQGSNNSEHNALALSTPIQSRQGQSTSSQHSKKIRRVESHNYPEIATPVQPQSTTVGLHDSISSPPSRAPSTGSATPNLTPYQLLVSDLCYHPDFGQCILACCCPYCVSGRNQMKLRDSGNPFYFFYGCCCLDCCGCFMSQDLQRRLGAPVNSCCYMLICHYLCRGLVLSKERMAIKEWILAGRPRYSVDGTVMV